jgi:hypothetical protein
MKPMTEEQIARIKYEDSTQDEQLTPQEQERKRARAAKRKSREGLKVQKAQAAQQKLSEKELAQQRARQDAQDKVLDQINDHHSFWAIQREALSPEEKQQYQTIHYEMADWSQVMNEYLQGTDGTTPQDLADTVVEINSLVKTTGLAPTELLLIPNFWKKSERPLFQLVAATSETARVFANYGYLLGPMAHVYSQFHQKFLMKSMVVQSEEHVVLECTSCKGLSSRVSVPKSIALRYQELNKSFKCDACRQRDNALMSSMVGYKSATKDTIFDAYGRFKDKD